MKKLILSILLSISLLASFVGCESGSTGSTESTESNSEKESVGQLQMEKETMPTYLDNEASVKFPIGMWVGVPEFKFVIDSNETITGQVAWTDEEFLEQFEMIAESGITLASTPLGIFSVDHIIRSLEASEQVGIDFLVWHAELNNVLLNTSISDKEAIIQARRLTAEYAEYTSFYGNMITDEPHTSEFEALGVAARRYKQLFPDKMFYLNMFPVYANSVQLGVESYEKYVEQYMETVGLDYFCYDNYPLKRGKEYGTTLIREDFLYNMELAHGAGEDVRVWTFLQSMGFGGNKDPNCVEDFRFQANASLAYGIEGIQWFCYWDPRYGGSENFTSAYVTLDGQKTHRFNMAKQANTEIHAIWNVLENFKWERVMTYIGTDNLMGENSAFNYLTTTNTHNRIYSVKAKKDTFAGVFKDGEGRDGFMFVNYDAPTSKEINTVEIQFKNCTQAVVYINGARTEVEVKNGKVALQLKASDAAFIIPLYI